MNIPEDERVENVCEFMGHLAHTYLPLGRWNFQESYRSKEKGLLIFDSQWCRIKFVWDGWDMRGGNTISIYYGRLHAPDNNVIMAWNKEDCHCWHREELVLHYLDERSPEDAAKSINTHRIIKKYRESDIGQSLSGNRRQPEWLVRMHATTWEEYSPRLFEIFDLQRSELWNKYTAYLKDVYDIKGRNPIIKPPLDKIC